MHGGALDVLGQIDGGIEHPLILRGPAFPRLRQALREVFVPSLAVEPPEFFTALILIRHHEPAPALAVRSGGGLQAEFEAIHHDLSRHFAREIEAFAHRARRGEEFVGHFQVESRPCGPPFRCKIP